MPSSPNGERTISRLLSNAKERAKRNDLPFALSLDDILIPEKCPLTDIPLVSHLGTGGSQGPRYNSPTIDRVIPARGYVPGNIEIISSLANSLMGTVTDPEILSPAAQTFAERIHRYHQKERNYEDSYSRYRDGQLVTQDDNDPLLGNSRRKYKEAEQLHLKLDSGGNKTSKRS